MKEKEIYEISDVDVLEHEDFYDLYYSRMVALEYVRVIPNSIKQNITEIESVDYGYEITKNRDENTTVKCYDYDEAINTAYKMSKETKEKEE